MIKQLKHNVKCLINVEDDRDCMIAFRFKSHVCVLMYIAQP